MEASRASYNDSVMNDFADDSRKKQREAGLPTVLLLSALIYMGLYGFFIFGNAVYMYSDVGSDSLSSSYPIITMLARLYREKQFSFYTLSSGLGSDTSATFLQYLNPLKFLLLNFGKESFPFAVLLFVFLQHVFTAVFAYGFFKSLLRAKRPAVFAALIWGYTSYIVVWGQNYSFGICILLFTASMFFLQLLRRVHDLLCDLLHAFRQGKGQPFRPHDKTAPYTGVLCPDGNGRFMRRHSADRHEFSRKRADRRHGEL